LTFIQKPNEFKPIKTRLWERQFGSEFNHWEWNIISEFNQAKKEKYVKVSGAVINNTRLGKGQFLLVPAPHLPQDHLLCICQDQEIPANNAYVTIQGRNVWRRNHYEVFVDSIQQADLNIPVKPEIEFQEFENLLFEPWRGIDQHVADVFSFQFVSCPPLFAINQAGGLVISSYDGTRARLGKKLLAYFKNLLPKEILLGKPSCISVPYMNIRLRTLPFSWQYKTIFAEKTFPPLFLKFMTERKSAFSELSIGVEPGKEAPLTIYDKPLTISDQSTFLTRSVENRKLNNDPPLEIIKYIATQQMFAPKAGNTKEDFAKLMATASEQLIKTAESYDIPDAAKSHGLFDPNYYGKPQSILRIALSAARALNQKEISDKWISESFERYCLKNYMTILEDLPDIVTRKGVEMVTLEREIDRQIFKFISDHESKEYGVGIYQIDDVFVKYTDFEIRESLTRLREMGRLYENPRDVFRTVGLA
jgi:hypothetical protein